MFASQDSRTVVELPSAGLPADHGLATLGLLMQLTGRTTAALAALLASTALLDLEHLLHGPWFWLGVASCFARAQLHRLAGRDLTYRRSVDGVPADPFAAMHTYIRFGIAHALIVGLVAVQVFHWPAITGVAISGALAVWPAVLWLVAIAPRFQRFRAGIPLGEDRGLEGASIVMTVIGAYGAVAAGASFPVLGALPAQRLEHGWGVMLVLVFAMLVVRASFHIRAGLAGLRDGSFDRPGELAARYAAFGVISACCIGGVLCLLAVSEALAPEAIVSVAVACWLLMIWPMVIKRFFHQRQFVELLAGDRVLHRRSPDAGLTSLGWLLLGHAALATVLLILPPQRIGLAASANAASLDRWWSLGPGIDAWRLVLELAAAVALIRMSDHRRWIATIYALFACAVGLIGAFPLLRDLDAWRVFQLLPVGAQLVIPLAVLWLLRRVAVPLARARYRRTGPFLPARSRVS